MPGPILISADVESAEAALEVAAALDELAGAVAAFEIHAEEGGHAALWRGGAHPPQPGLDAPAGNPPAPSAAGAGRPPGPPAPGAGPPPPQPCRKPPRPPPP